MDIAIFACIVLMVASAVGVVVSIAHTYQEWWAMGIVERIASIVGIACCVAGMVVSFPHWY